MRATWGALPYTSFITKACKSSYLNCNIKNLVNQYFLDFLDFSAFLASSVQLITSSSLNTIQ